MTKSEIIAPVAEAVAVEQVHGAKSASQQEISNAAQDTTPIFYGRRVPEDVFMLRMEKICQLTSPACESSKESSSSKRKRDHVNENSCASGRNQKSNQDLRSILMVIPDSPNLFDSLLKIGRGIQHQYDDIDCSGIWTVRTRTNARFIRPDNYLENVSFRPGQQFFVLDAPLNHYDEIINAFRTYAANTDIFSHCSLYVPTRGLSKWADENGEMRILNALVQERIKRHDCLTTIQLLKQYRALVAEWLKQEDAITQYQFFNIYRELGEEKEVLSLLASAIDANYSIAKREYEQYADMLNISASPLISIKTPQRM